MNKLNTDLLMCMKSQGKKVMEFKSMRMYVLCLFPHKITSPIDKL